MTNSRRTILWAWCAVVYVASVLVLIIALQETLAVRAGGIALGFWFPAVATTLGALVAVRQPRNRISWLLMGIGLGVLIEFALQLLFTTEPTAPTALDLVAIVLMYVALPGAMYLAFMVPFLFPNGHFQSRRQSLVAGLGVVTLGLQMIVTTFTEEIGPPFPAAEQSWTVANPVGFIPATWLFRATVVTLVVLVVIAIYGVISLAMRYRQSTVTERAQIRWVLFSISIVTVVLVLVSLSNASQSAVGALLLVIAFGSVPVSITVAITRYRLFEIDRIISRTLSYTAVVGVLTASFLGLVALATSLVPAQSSLAVAASTLAAAALFNPLRKRVQVALDRRFNRSAYQAEIISEKFSTQLRESLPSNQIIDEWRQTVNESLQPTASGVWIKDRDGDGPQ